MASNQPRQPSNKGKLVDQKPPLKLTAVEAIRIHLHPAHPVLDLVMLILAIGSKPPGCDLLNLRFRDVTRRGISGSGPWSCSACHSTLSSLESTGRSFGIAVDAALKNL